MTPWIDFFAQHFVAALAWLAAATVWLVGAAVLIQLGLWLASKWPFAGDDPESYS